MALPQRAYALALAHDAPSATQAATIEKKTAAERRMQRARSHTAMGGAVEQPKKGRRWPWLPTNHKIVRGPGLAYQLHPGA